MSSLINRLQRALLGSAGPEKVKALLAELAIPAGGSGGSIREVRRGVLRPISDEAILRDALAAMGISGGGGNASQGLSDIRNAVLHNVVNPEGQLLAGLNELLEPGDLAGGGGPEWVPEGAVAYADFVNSHYYAGGAEKTLAQIIANPGKVVAGEGLAFSDTENTGVAMLGDFAAAFLTINWTIDLSWKVPFINTHNSRTCTVFSVHNASGTDLALVTVMPEGYLGVIQDWIDDWNDTGREANIGTAESQMDTVETGSVTRTDAQISAHYRSVDVSDDSSEFTFTPTVAEFGDAPGEFYYPGTIYIRTVAVFSPD